MVFPRVRPSGTLKDPLSDFLNQYLTDEMIEMFKIYGWT